MKKGTRILVLLSILAMLLSSVNASAVTVSDPGSFPIVDEKIELSKSTQENGQLEATEESGEKMEDKAKDEAGEPQGNSEKKPEEKTEGAEDGGLVREVEQIGAGQVIALTFDDGPSEFTSGLLDILKREQVPATFFVLGRNASAYLDLIRREIAEGHEVESHTMNHQNLAKLDEASVRAEVYGVE